MRCQFSSFSCLSQQKFVNSIFLLHVFINLFLPLDLDMSIAYWNIILNGRFKFLDIWCEFLLVSKTILGYLSCIDPLQLQHQKLCTPLLALTYDLFEDRERCIDDVVSLATWSLFVVLITKIMFLFIFLDSYITKRRYLKTHGTSC